MGEEERRQFFRLPCPVNVRWQKVALVSGVSSPWTLSQAADISAGGVRMMLGAWVRKGDELKLEIELGMGDVVYGMGKVMWMKPSCEAGVNFEHMDDATRAHISQFIVHSLKEGS